MNTEVIKAMTKETKNLTVWNKISKWWRKNNYKIYRLVLFPIWFGIVIKEKIDKYIAKQNAWNENRAEEILNYYIPRSSDWDNDAKEFFFFDNGLGWYFNLAKRKLKRKDYNFWKTNNGWNGGKIREYLIKKFELEGFSKQIIDTTEGRTEIVFKLNENVDIC